MRIIETKIYHFEELSPKAKEKAIQNARECLEFSDYSSYIIDDAKAIAILMGWNISEVRYSGFYSQGDGAMFVGTMHHNTNHQWLCSTSSYAPTDTDLHDIATRWHILQQSNEFALSADVRHSGRYSHEYCTEFDCFDSRTEDGYGELTETEDKIKEIARDFMRWIYKQLEDEYEFQTSDGMLRELLDTNDCEFTEDGKSI